MICGKKCPPSCCCFSKLLGGLAMILTFLLGVILGSLIPGLVLTALPVIIAIAIALLLIIITLSVLRHCGVFNKPKCCITEDFDSYC